MKTLYIIIGSIVVFFIIAQFFIHRSSTKIEFYPYTVAKLVEEIEIRDYQARLFTNVPLANEGYKQNASNGFSKLGGYIFGANERNQKIAMTSPVSMSIGDSVTMMFMVPKEIKKEDLPKLNQSNIVFKEEPAKTMAAISFSGWANDNKIKSFKDKLTLALEKHGIVHQKRFYFFGYNAPYEVFNRLNEVLVEIEAPHDSY